MSYTDRFLQVPSVLVYDLEPDTDITTEDGIPANMLIADSSFTFNLMSMDGFGPYNPMLPDGPDDYPYTMVYLRGGNQFICAMNKDDFESLVNAHYKKING